MLDVALNIWAWADTIAVGLVVFALGVLIGTIIMIALVALVTHVAIWVCGKLDEFEEARR